MAALALLVMLPAVGHDLLNWDDNRVIIENKAVTTAGGIGTIWSSLELPRGFPNYPLTMSMYWLEHQLWGLQPAGYHIINILLHAANAVLLLALLRRLGLNEWAAVLAASLFAAHPMQVESVAWVAERKNVLFTLFALLTLLSYLKFLDTQKRGAWGWAFAAFSAALLAKTAAVTVPCTLLATIWLKRERLSRKDVLPLVPFFALAVIAGLVTAGVESPPREFLPLLWRPLLAVNTLAFYLARLVFPVAVVPVHPKWDFEPGGVFLIAPLALIFVLVLLFRYRRTLPRIAWWGVVHFLASLGPFLGLMAYGYHETSYVADRYVYFASFGLFAPLAVGIVHVLKRFDRRAAVGIGAAYVTLMAVVTFLYVPVWRDSITLWLYTLKHNPDCANAHNNLATLYEAQGQFDLALAHYAYAFKVDPYNSAAMANYGGTLARLGDFDRGESYLMRAIEVAPRSPVWHYRLGCLHVTQGRYEDALVHFRIAERLEPGNDKVLCMAGYAHENLGNVATAERLYREALELRPDLDYVRTQLQRMLEANDEAIASAHEETDS